MCFSVLTEVYKLTIRLSSSDNLTIRSWPGYFLHSTEELKKDKIHKENKIELFRKKNEIKRTSRNKTMQPILWQIYRLKFKPKYKMQMFFERFINFSS